MALSRHLVIFARHPRLGTGKRRLARDIGPVQAVRFQHVMLSLTVSRLAHDRRWTCWLAMTPRYRAPWPPGRMVLFQGSGDLGRRMVGIARSLPPGPVIIVGCDIPGMTQAHIARAFRALGSHDAVFGPATDGGYWLVGLRRRPHFRDPFRGVRWSTEHALGDTVANLASGKVAFVDALSDVDDGEALRCQPDWNRLHKRTILRAGSEDRAELMGTSANGRYCDL